MQTFWILISVFGYWGLIALIILIIYLIIRRVKDKGNESFEKRKN